MFSLIKLFILFMTCIYSLKSENYSLKVAELFPAKIYFSAEFDFLVFRQIWPQSTCMFPGHHSCSIAKNVDTWVVHGLWPSIVGRHDGPFYCNKTLPFNPRKLDWLLSRLEEYWPNLYTDTPLESFWKHEWTKHGTCALGLPHITDESDYFESSLDLRDHFDFGPILKGSSIVPDDTKTYKLEEMQHAIKSVLGVQPMLTCYIIKNEKKQYLSQMQICLNKKYEQIDCKSNSMDILEIDNINDAEQTDCKPGVPIHYPTIHYKPNF